MTVYDRILDLMTCQQRGWPVSQEDLEEPMLQAPVPELGACFASPELMQAPSGSNKHRRYQTEGEQDATLVGLKSLITLRKQCISGVPIF